MTSNDFGRTGFALFNTAFPSGTGFLVPFDLFVYDTTSSLGADTGGDGISFILVDGSSSPTAPGAAGGGLGYSQLGSQPALLAATWVLASTSSKASPMTMAVRVPAARRVRRMLARCLKRSLFAVPEAG